MFSIPWIWAIAGRLNQLKSYPNEVNDKIRWEPIVLLALLLAVFRLVLAPGITFVPRSVN